jgi:phosphohistidine phosphatase SixA
MLLGLRLIVGLLLGVLPARAQADLLSLLRDGGLIVFLRHAETGSASPDQALAVPGECESQRNLNETGRAQSLEIGAAFRDLGIPVTRVLASPFCRTMETATLAFGKAEPEPALTLPRHVDAAARQAMGAALLGLLPAAPPLGNWVLVGHSYHIIAAGGPPPQPQGAAAILRPLGEGRFTVLAQIPPSGWRDLERLRFAGSP